MTRLRPGDQQLPVVNDSVAIQDLVVADLESFINRAPKDAEVIRSIIKDVAARKQVGISRYGTPLQANNGRNAYWDAYEEALDLFCYLRQLLQEGEPVSLLYSKARTMVLLLRKRITHAPATH